MKSLLIVVVCVLGLTGCSNQNANQSGYISQNISLYDPKIILDFVKKNKITPEQAMHSIDSMQKSLKVSYIGYNLKKDLINKSGDEIFNECKADLAARLKIDSEGLSSFEFYDHVMQCLAGFKDSHFGIDKALRPSFISTGVSEVMKAHNKFYILRNRPGLISKLEELQKLPVGSLQEKLKVGTEIVSIDGQPPQMEVNRLKKYISASSDLAREYKATNELFTRNFAYPTKSDLSLTLKLIDGSTVDVVLPWMQFNVGSAQGTLESRALLSDRGIAKILDLLPDKKLIFSEGASLADPLFKNITNRRSYQTEEDEDVLLTGVVSLKNRNYCYLQLNSFNFDSDKEFGFKITEKINETKYPLSLPVVLKNYLQSCEVFKAPLIFDLRNNGGGNSRLAHLIYALFENDQTKITYTARSNLTEIGNYSLIGKYTNSIDGDNPDLDDILFFTTMKQAHENKLPVTDWVLTKNMKLEKNIYSGQVFILTSTNCVSACEITANRFKIAGRATIIGESTSGTGFGFSSYENAETKFRDPLNLFEIGIMNFAFQSVVVEDDKDFKTLSDLKGSALSFDKIKLLENNPVTPNIVIEYTLNDILNEYSDYIQSLTKILEQDEVHIK